MTQYSGQTVKYRNRVRGRIASFACRGRTHVAGWAADMLESFACTACAA